MGRADRNAAAAVSLALGPFIPRPLTCCWGARDEGAEGKGDRRERISPMGRPLEETIPQTSLPGRGTVTVWVTYSPGPFRLRLARSKAEGGHFELRKALVIAGTEGTRLW